MASPMLCVPQVAQETFVRELLPDVLRFAGASMNRRIVGIAHVADMESISDLDVRYPTSEHVHTS